MYLHENIKADLSSAQPFFDQMMALRGECFRQQKGRTTHRIRLGKRNYFIKQHFGVGWKEIFKNLWQFRLPILSAKNEWLAIQKLKALGIDVPTVFAYGQRGSNPACLQSFIVTEELAPTVSLEELCQTWQIAPPPFAWKGSLIEKVADIARTLHQHGLNHRDFYLCHFLLRTAKKNDQNNNGLPLKLYLIDLHRAQIRHLTPRRWIIKDLAGLYFSSKNIGLTQRDLYRFMKHYLGKSLREIMASDKEFWIKVKRRGEKLYCDFSK